MQRREEGHLGAFCFSRLLGLWFCIGWWWLLLFSFCLSFGALCIVLIYFDAHLI